MMFHFPIIGKTQPNDNFRKQLVDNASQILKTTRLYLNQQSEDTVMEVRRVANLLSHDEGKKLLIIEH